LRLFVLIFRLDTDILLAGRCGLKSLLVLTGFSTLNEVDMKRSSSSADDHKQVPDFYLQSLADLGPLLDWQCILVLIAVWTYGH